MSDNEKITLTLSGNHLFKLFKGDEIAINDVVIRCNDNIIHKFSSVVSNITPEERDIEERYNAVQDWLAFKRAPQEVQDALLDLKSRLSINESQKKNG